MKKINYFLFCCLLSIAVLTGCKSDDGGGGDPPNPEADALKELQGTWDVTSVKRDASDLTDTYSDMQLKISNKNITTPGAPDDSKFPEGAFTFVDGSDFNTIVVDGITVDLNASATSLEADFSLDEDGNDASKVLIIAGAYEFKFTKVQ